MRVGHLLGPELEALLESNPAEVASVLDDVHPEDLADAVEAMPDERVAALLTELPTDYAAQVFERLDEDRQETLAEQLGVESTAALAMEMDADERADFFSVIPADVSATLLEHLEHADPEIAEDVEELTRWPETSAGGLMTTDYLSFGPHLTVRQAIEQIREHADETETINAFYVVEGDERVVGVLPVRIVLIAEPDDLLLDVMRRNVISVPPDMDQEDVARVLSKYDLTTLPVISDEGKLLGVITSDDILDVLTEEQNEDVQKMAAIEPLRDGYFDTNFSVFIRKRAPWLLVLFTGGFLATQTLRAFEHELNAITQLAFYLPLVISAGGNSGSQSSTLVIRSLAVGDIVAPDWWRVLSREVLQGVTLGGMLATLGTVHAAFVGDNVEFAALIGVTIVLIVTIGCVIGAMTPIALHKLGIDPATSSTPFIATLVDVLGIVLYLGLARVLLAGVLASAAG